MTTTDWRTDTLKHIRGLIEDADPEMTEEAKWVKPSNPAGVPTWSHDGIVCMGEMYKQHVKITFAYGASLDDPDRLFNASLDAGTRRVIDITEGTTPDADAFRALVRRAVEHNVSRSAAKRRT